MVSAAEAPNVTDWMQGWGSVLGLPLAFGAMIFTGLLLLHEIRVRRQERYHNDTAQARLVRVDRIHHDDGVDRASARITYRVHNRSAAPVFDVHVLHPSQDGDRYDSPSRMITIEGGEKGSVSITDPSLVADVGPNAKYSHSLDLPFVLVFTDAEGRRWSRYLGAGLPERMLRELSPGPGSIFGLLLELLYLRGKLQTALQWIDRPRRWAKSTLRRKIWKRRQEGIHRTTEEIKAFLKLQDNAMAADEGDAKRDAP
ncbi:hypothetical protein [Couchioplanes azureus]|uniref:hypothetical protein n=1 Tax=Couchioplanes caeruleus TaxID=56438 RepID=UPI00167020F7|nr:hypothetical protein [Couchioplanes caeruleus]